MKVFPNYSSWGKGIVWGLALFVSFAISGKAAPDTVQEATAPRFPGTGAAQPAVWEFGPMEGNVQPFRVKITGFDSTNLTEGLVLSIPGQAAPRSSGHPDLPLVSALLRGQAGKKVRVEVSQPQWVVISGIRVAPAESPALDETTGEASETRLVRIPAAPVYGANEFWPAELVRVEEAWIGADKRLRLECALLQVNPVDQLLRYTLVLEGRLIFEAEVKPDKP